MEDLIQKLKIEIIEALNLIHLQILIPMRLYSEVVLVWTALIRSN